MGLTFSRLLDPGAPGGRPPSIRAASWNARALVHHCLAKRRAKTSIMAKLLAKVEILCLQESHGCWAQINAICREFAEGFRVFTSFCGSANEGGLVTLVRDHWIDGRENCRH